MEPVGRPWWVVRLSVVSYQGYDYETVAVGDQCWFAENLRVTEYQNGDAILLSEDPVEWSNLTGGGYCAKDLNEANAAVFGYLYNGYGFKTQEGFVLLVGDSNSFRHDRFRRHRGKPCGGAVSW